MPKDVRFNIKLIVDGQERIVSASTNTKELVWQLGMARKEADSFRKGVDRWGQSVMGFAAIQTAISSFRSAMHGLLDESLSFGGAMREANTMASKNSQDFERLKDQVAELAKTVPVARDALAKGLYQVISNGVPYERKSTLSTHCCSLTVFYNTLSAMWKIIIIFAPNLLSNNQNHK